MKPNKLITGGTSSWPVEPSKVLYAPIDKARSVHGRQDDERPARGQPLLPSEP